MNNKEESRRKGISIMEGSNVEELDSQNHRRTSQTLAVEEDCDRISKLPIEILHHILSFLPITTAVQTSLVSKRWQSLWTTIPCMHFDEELFYTDGEVVVDPVVKFIKFVDSFMILYNSPSIQKFCVASSEYCDASHVCAWVQAAMAHNTQEVELDVSSEEPVQLPECLFTSQSLKVLELSLHNGFLKVPGTIALPRLKTLHLSSVKFEDPNWSLQLFPNCPNLESLSLEICDWDVVKVLNISAPALKTLVISSSPWFDYGQNSIGSKLEISAPKLESFIYRGLLALDYDFGSFSLLHTAKLEFRHCRLMDRDLASCLRRMLKAIIHAKLVYLSSWTVELMSSDQTLLEDLHVFFDLKRLNMSTTFSRVELQSIIRMLQHMPSLQFLTVQLIRVGSTDSAHFLTEELSLDFVPPYLKVVEINHLSISWSQIMLVRRILETAESLERMIIELQCMNSGAQTLLRQSIEMLPRASSSCEIEFKG